MHSFELQQFRNFNFKRFYGSVDEYRHLEIPNFVKTNEVIQKEKETRNNACNNLT